MHPNRDDENHPLRQIPWRCARGFGQRSKRRRRASLYAEREIVQALVEAASADEVFEFLSAAAGIGRPHAGILLMEKAEHGIPLVLPDEQ